MLLFRSIFRSAPFRRAQRLCPAMLALPLPLVSTAAEPSFIGPLAAGTLEGPPRHETSGIALSQRAPQLVWTHDDSGGEPELYASDLTTGKRRGTLRVKGGKNDDWEDLASFQKDGKAWLLIGDIGDNDANRKSVRLHLIEEPDPVQLKPTTVVEVVPTYSIRFHYPDGPRDCESLAVDPAEGMAYLLTKRDSPPVLYRVPLVNSGGKNIAATRVEEVPTIVSNTRVDALIKKIVGKKFSWPTSMAFSPDGRMAVVLTYGEPLVFTREPGESWEKAFQQSPIRLLFHGLPQAEAVCFSADNRSFFVASEEASALIRYDLEVRTH